MNNARILIIIIMVGFVVNLTVGLWNNPINDNDALFEEFLGNKTEFEKKMDREETVWGGVNADVDKGGESTVLNPVSSSFSILQLVWDSVWPVSVHPGMFSTRTEKAFAWVIMIWRILFNTMILIWIFMLIKNKATG